jgi:hypothetical protein
VKNHISMIFSLSNKIFSNIYIFQIRIQFINICIFILQFTNVFSLKIGLSSSKKALKKK